MHANEVSQCRGRSPRRGGEAGIAAPVSYDFRMIFARRIFPGGRFTCKNTVFSDESLSERTAKKGSKKAPKTTIP